ncbi:ATP-binding protein [Helicobacter cetorum]|uniref:ATP-binding protein n=1 Tax=Helicobacter cetorum TaxID=138563 RepID=UPI000CF19FEE|nr:ATP-binding protein [Helicobacter cetorum]
MPFSCLYPFGPFDTFSHSFLQNPLLALDSDKICLLGAPQVGKTSFALDMTKHFKNPIYIDYNDMRLNKDVLNSWLLKWYLEKKMDLLILDNVEQLDFSLPKLPKIVLIPSPLSSLKIPQDFSPCYALGLSFKEYVSSFKPNTPKNTLFNRFLKEGNALDSRFFESHSEREKTLQKQKNIKLAFQAHAPLLAKICAHQSHFTTAFYLYTQFKKELKISKDTLYKFLHTLEEKHLIFLVPSFENNKSKLYLYDFALPYYLTPNPSLLSVFENMVFLELYKQFPHYKICVQDNGLFILLEDSIPKIAFIAHVFPTPAFLDKQLAWCNKHSLKSFIISINGASANHSQTFPKNQKHISFIEFSLNLKYILI